MRPSPVLRATLFAAALPLAAAPALAGQSVVTYSSLDSATKPTQVQAQLFRPEGVGPFPAMVAFHGCSGLYNKNGLVKQRETEWAEALNARGYVVLFPDSFGSRRASTQCNGEDTVHPWSERADDAYGALLYLQAQPFVIGQRIGVMGWSHGGGTVLFTIEARPHGRPTSLPKGDFRAAVAFYPGWCDEKALGLSWTTAIPLLWLNGADDDWTPAAPCQAVMDEVKSHGAPIAYKTYPGAYHDFDWPGDPVHVMHVGGAHPRDVHLGFDQAAHDDAHKIVPEFLDRVLKP